MDGFDSFEHHLHDALIHLYDPAYVIPQVVWSALDCDPARGQEALQSTLIRAIEDLKPSPEVPATAHIRRIYEVLRFRYVNGLTQEDASDRMGITPRHLRREQREAIRVLARRLWDRGQAGLPSSIELSSGDLSETAGHTPAAVEPDAWLCQLREELGSLHKSAPGVVADVASALQGVADVGKAFNPGHGIELTIEGVEPNLVAQIHPSALRQILIAAVGSMAKGMERGQIGISVEDLGSEVGISITARPTAAGLSLNRDLIQEIVTAHGGYLETALGEDALSVRVRLKSVRPVEVLVVDDNADLVHFYRRYTEGTRYHITHEPRGHHVIDAIGKSRPGIVLLDVMLPDIDGWQLLTLIRGHPACKAIPVIVCSVIREEQLALSLGATLYLPKPVRRRQFIQALDQALTRDSEASPTSQVSNVAHH